MPTWVQQPQSSTNTYIVEKPQPARPFLSLSCVPNPNPQPLCSVQSRSRLLHGHQNLLKPPRQWSSMAEKDTIVQLLEKMESRREISMRVAWKAFVALFVWNPGLPKAITKPGQPFQSPPTVFVWVFQYNFLDYHFLLTVFRTHHDLHFLNLIIWKFCLLWFHSVNAYW